MRLAAAGVLVVLVCASPSAVHAQTLPPTAGKDPTTQETISRAAPRPGQPAPQLKWYEQREKRWLLPLAYPGVRRQWTDAKDGREYTLNFWSRNGSVNPADQVQFLYTFGDESRKGLAADLAALIFPGGWRLAVGSSVSSSGNTSGDQTPEQAIQRLRDGGDMYVTVAYPLISVGTKETSYRGSVFVVPRINFLFDGFGGTQTVTEATEHTTNLGLEAYFDLADLEKKGGAFVYARAGAQHVSPEFQKATGLEAQTFAVIEVAVGAQVGDLLRISLQHFQAPPAAAGVSLEQLQGWHLVLQLAPKVK